MNRQAKGTIGLTTVLDHVARVRTYLLSLSSALIVASLVTPFVFENRHFVTHANSAMLSTACLAFAFTVGPRLAVGMAVGSAAWLIGVALAQGVELLIPLPVALLTVIVSVLVVMTRRTIARHETAQASLERHRNDLEDALAISYRQVLYAEALSTAAQAYLTSTGADRRVSALTELLHATDTDLVRVSRNATPDGETLTAVVESQATSAAARDWKSFDTVTWTRLPNLMSTLASCKAYIYTRREEIPYPDRQLYEEVADVFRAAIHMPIVVDGRWEGTVSTATLQSDRTWRDGEITLLRSVADMVAAAWGREHALDRLGDAIDQRDRSLRLQAALTDSSRTLLESDSEDPLVEALSIVRAAVGVTTAYLESTENGAEGPRRATLHAVTPGKDRPQRREGLWSAWPYAYAELREGRPYIIDDIDQLPDRERSWYMVNDSALRAELSFPVMQDGRLVAIVGIGHDRPRRWTASEMRMMGSVARMIGAYWQRDSVRQALEDLIRSKDRFIASVSHELRTPMAVVLGLSTELNTRREDFTEEEAAEFIDLVARQAREVTHIIEDLLVSARATETAITVIPEPVRLDREVGEVLADLPSEYTFKVKKVEVAEMVAMADPVRARQILRNLIINSHRHGGDVVAIEGRIEGDFAHILVCDNGQGIPEGRAEEIFQAYATSGERTGMTAAIGLGLTVSRQLARLMGGDVVYRHDDRSVFDLSLPGVPLPVSDEIDTVAEVPAELEA